MTSPFTFLPRAVSKYTKEWQGISKTPPSPSPPADATTDNQDDDYNSDPDDNVKGKEKAVESTQDIATLISLALSDYNIWLDPDLCWKLDACLQDDVSPDNAGFVPINYLLRRAPFRCAFPSANGQPGPSETEVVKALRAHGSGTLEVRMRLPSSSGTSASGIPASSVWFATGKTARKKDVGGYEVRRRDWGTLRYRPTRGWTRARWDDVIAYVECIPPQYRSIGGIARFVEALLSALDMDADADTEAGPCHHIQSVSLPPHYLDKPGDVPKCKGYALVTFSKKSDLEHMLRAWPWQRHLPPTSDDAPPVVKEAVKYGLRAISKARWEALNEEYLTYKQALVEEVARAEMEIRHTRQDTPERGESTALSLQTPPEMHPQTENKTETQTTPSSPYPFGCLVFVRNVHPDTNKTTLKSLFAQAFQDQDGSVQRSGSATMTMATGLDYVDFNRGTDSCYIRLASPSHTMCLHSYFTAHPKTQTHGLDKTGRTPLAGDKLIAMEQVRGKKEEVYWERIPDKVRRQAVERVVQAQLARRGEVEANSQSATGRSEDSGSRLRKRAREC